MTCQVGVLSDCTHATAGCSLGPYPPRVCTQLCDARPDAMQQLLRRGQQMMLRARSVKTRSSDTEDAALRVKAKQLRLGVKGR